LAEYSTGAGNSKKEALAEMTRLWSEAIKQNDNRGFLVIYPYEQHGSGKRLQLGNPIDGEFMA